MSNQRTVWYRFCVVTQHQLVFANYSLPLKALFKNYPYLHSEGQQRRNQGGTSHEKLQFIVEILLKIGWSSLPMILNTQGKPKIA